MNQHGDSMSLDNASDGAHYMHIIIIIIIIIFRKSVNIMKILLTA
jgi:hypothetical protein